MVELRPYPFAKLVERMLREAEAGESIFDLPLRRCFLGREDLDLSVRFHGKRAATPLGPAAGPQSQMAQNLVLSWLVGCRILELKTVQIQDRLTIPRPCIDMETVGYNVEWSQELRLEESLEEYVKGSMLIEILQASELLQLAPGFGEVVFDMSVGYDLEGIRTPRVARFIESMCDARAVVDRLRSELPPALRRFRDLDFRTSLSDTLTLSTFHGCPPDEIERIVEHFYERHGLHCIVKLNPTLLGPERVRTLLHDHLGYGEVRVPDAAFAKDTTWEQMEAFVPRLGRRADELGLGFGVKFTNTLVVENHRAFFPGEKEMYLSGAPLHVLAMELVDRFRATFGERYPISFSAGVDQHNFAPSVALGLVPVTVCSDLLRPGGYARAHRYFAQLEERMRAVGARDLEELRIRGMGHGAEALAELGEVSEDVRAACARALQQGQALRPVAGDELLMRWAARSDVHNTRAYARELPVDPRYARAANAKPPVSTGRPLELFDCTTCDKCVPVCPNHANFAFTLPRLEQPLYTLQKGARGWAARPGGSLVLEKRAQYGTFADFCNECGNCDVFCPDLGGPYLVKPRFFGDVADWRAFSTFDGFALDPAGTFRGRFEGAEYGLERATDDGRERFQGPGFDLRLVPETPHSDPVGDAAPDVTVDLAYYHILRWIREGVYDSAVPNYLNALSRESP